MTAVCILPGVLLGWVVEQFMDGDYSEFRFWFLSGVKSLLIAFFGAPCAVGVGHGGSIAPLPVGWWYMSDPHADVFTGVLSVVGGFVLWAIVFTILVVKGKRRERREREGGR